jgi:hypothetical protein
MRYNANETDIMQTKDVIAQYIRRNKSNKGLKSTKWDYNANLNA